MEMRSRRPLFGTSGATGLALSLVLGKMPRLTKHYQRPPHSLPSSLLCCVVSS